jgi:lipooligosaccharide transport system ATP-binding protein
MGRAPYSGCGRAESGFGAGPAGAAAAFVPHSLKAMSAISLRGVVKRYGAVTAVAGLDLEVSVGVCFGLLGPNGAGKSTTMRMLTAQAIADEGEITVLGHRLPEDSKEARARCGVVPQLDNLDVELTVRQVLVVFSHLYRVPRAERAEAVDRALGQANLRERADERVEHLSGGMRRRLLIARGLVHAPELVLLDEPTVGLDPQVRQELWSLIDRLRGEGVTVLMSTHYIEEAERLADTVAIMASGSIVAQGTPAELVSAHAGREVVEVYASPAVLRELEAGADRDGLPTRRTGTALAFLRAEALDGDAPDGERRPANLEDAFVAVTGQDIA